MSLGDVNPEVNPIYYRIALMQELLAHLHKSSFVNVVIKPQKSKLH